MTVNNRSLVSSEELFLTYENVCDRYKIHRRTLIRWVNENHIPLPVVIGKRRLFKIGELEQYERTAKRARGVNIF